MDPQLATLLAAVEKGDDGVLGSLGDLLEKRGDPRAVAARKGLEPDAGLIALVLYRLFRSELHLLSTTDTPVTDLDLAIDRIIETLDPEYQEGSIAGSISFEDSLREVNEALRTGRRSPMLSQAIAEAGRIKRERFLALFQET